MNAQVDWEQQMVALGVARFRGMEEKAKDGSRFVQTSAGSKLLVNYLPTVSEEIMAEVSNRKRRNMYIKLVKGVDPDKLAMFTMHIGIECVFSSMSVQAASQKIGKLVEDELRFSRFNMELPEYYNQIIRDLDARNSTQYRHRHRVLVHTMNDKGVEWTQWSNEVHIGVGAFLLGCMERCTDLIERAREGNKTVIRATPEAEEWIANHDAVLEVRVPDRLPCVEKPLDWTDWKNGGFHTPRLRHLTPLVKTRFGAHREAQSALLNGASMPRVLSSVNAMQATQWAINGRVREVLQEVWDRGLEVGMPRSQPYEIPASPVPREKASKDFTPEEREKFEQWKIEARTLHALEADRRSAVLGVMRALRTSTMLSDMDVMWFVYQLDFRGRAYCTANGVSPQGDDISKSLLKFKRGEVLGERGWFWFCVHGANKFGNDKGSFQERVDWVYENMEHFIRAGEDPLAYTDVWSVADKPYQFLAWCIEFSQASEGNPHEFVSHIPVALDGSCNGLQHFSAMLRDPVGGKSVNLLPSERPSDIYQDVADVATKKLRSIIQDPSHEWYPLAANWMGLFDKVCGGSMNRKMAKKPVMTLPYGSTRQTCTQSVYSWYLDQKLDWFPEGTGFKHAVFMSGILWDSIGEVVVAARAAMDWIQRVARMLGKENKPFVYTSPAGFPMVQLPPKTETKVVRAQIGGSFMMKIRKDGYGIDSVKAANGSSPNFVHDIDSTHMHMCVDAGVQEGIQDFAMIHDDFGVHACHIERWHVIIREQFVELHSGTPLLEDLRQQLCMEYPDVELPESPPQGTLDLREVLRSPHFFG